MTLTLIGYIMVASVMLFIGPSNFIDMSPATLLIHLMMALYGLACAFLVVSSFSRLYDGMLTMGWKDSIELEMLASCKLYLEYMRDD